MCVCVFISTRSSREWNDRKAAARVHRALTARAPPSVRERAPALIDREDGSSGPRSRRRATTIRFDVIYLAESLSLRQPGPLPTTTTTTTTNTINTINTTQQTWRESAAARACLTVDGVMTGKTAFAVLLTTPLVKKKKKKHPRLLVLPR